MSTAIISNSITHSIALQNSKLPVPSQTLDRNMVPDASLVPVGTSHSLQVKTLTNMTASKKQVKLNIRNSLNNFPIGLYKNWVCQEWGQIP